jgi:hypothetical protein
MARSPLLFRQSDLVRALKGAKAAGMKVSKVQIDADGKITVMANDEDQPSVKRKTIPL